MVKRFVSQQKAVVKFNMQTLKEQQKKAFDALKGLFGYKNLLASPRLVKVVVNAGTGKMRSDKTRNDVVEDRLQKITGQKPAPRGSKKSIAGFKLRQGETVGFAVTLRGARMFGFLDKLLNIVIPRMRDFKGISQKSVDAMGNLTIGIREHTVFPETSDEDLKDVFGLAVTLVTTARNREEALAFFKHIGVPFKKEEEKK